MHLAFPGFLRVLAFAAATLLVWRPQTSLAEPVEILAVDFPPYEFEQPENGLRGFDHETVIAAFERENINATIRYTQWSRAVGLATEGKATGILSCVKTKEREEIFLHSEPISTATVGFVTLSSFSGNLKTVEDGAKVKTGTIMSYVTGRELTEAGIPHDVSRSDEVALRKLKNGRIDALYSFVEGAYYIASARRLFIPGQLKHYPITVTYYRLCISKRWPGAGALMSAFNRGLAAIKADGTYDAIHARYR